MKSEKAEDPLNKRGRKPKGGKLYQRKTDNIVPVSPEQTTNVNIILHLKCSMKDLADYNNNISKIVKDPLEYDPSIPPNILTYDDENVFTNFSLYKENTFEENSKEELKKNIYAYDNDCISKPTETELEVSTNKEIYQKLKSLKINLYKDRIYDKKSACFWCTYEYETPSCYIPICDTDGCIQGYGSFCRPECAVAFLMKENIDDSIKFERYQLLNQIYGKIFNYSKNIKPSPNPFYLLDKFYGNLTIQEYRNLLYTNHTLLVVEKPMTRILPELHEDNDDYHSDICNLDKSKNFTGVYKVKKQSDKKNDLTKTSILKNNFGMCSTAVKV